MHTKTVGYRPVDLFIYSTSSQDREKELVDLSARSFPDEKVEVYRTPEALSQRLKNPFQTGSVVVLAPGSRQDLQEILSRRDLLRDLRVIIIIPDREVETIAIAHQLRPRYLTYLNESFGDLAAVLAKMVKVHLAQGSSGSHFKG